MRNIFSALRVSEIHVITIALYRLAVPHETDVFVPRYAKMTPPSPERAQRNKWLPTFDPSTASGTTGGIAQQTVDKARHVRSQRS